MITKMKKLSFLVYHREYEQFLLQLRQMGVVHVVQKQQGEPAAQLADTMQRIHAYEGVAARMARTKTNDTAPCHEANADEICKMVTNAENTVTQLQQAIPAIDKDLAALGAWGDFDWATIQQLEENGWHIRFYACQEKDFLPEWAEDPQVMVIDQQGGRIHFVTLTRQHDAPLPLEPLNLPTCNMAQLKLQREQTEQELAKANATYVECCNQYHDALRQAIATEKSNLDLMRVRLDGEKVADGCLMLLEGWIPAKQVPAFAEQMEQTGQYFEVSDPKPDDDIPIQMTNNRFFRLFEPLTKLYMLPSNGELDLTPFFAPFFMLFFGLCLGDMGYGLLMILAMPVFDKLFKLINPDFSKWLVPLFGGSTMLCGLLTGTAFGFNLYDIDLPFFQQMKDMFYQDNQQMFTLSLAIGVVQILFGMILKAANLTIQCGIVYALSTIGWIILLVTIGVAALTGIGFGHVVVIALLCVAGILIFFVNSPGKNLFLNFGLGLWDTYNMATGLLGDVLSYVRLFALGLSGGILASVFNSLAVGMSPKIPVVGFLVTALIFLAGHAINIFMNFLGAIVHPMRLTFVEFFKNAGYNGGGSEYKPFK